MIKKHSKSPKILIPQDYIESKILLVRRKKVMLDRDLAQLYNVTTGNLNKAVKRNIQRFPEDFMFQLNKDETESLRFQFGSSKRDSNMDETNSSRFQSGSLKRGSNIKYLPYVFTQEGIAMLSSILNSERAIFVNIQIMRAFVKLRELMISHKDLAQKIENLERKFKEHDKNFVIVFETIKQLINPPTKQKELIGFHPKQKKKGKNNDKKAIKIKKYNIIRSH